MKKFCSFIIILLGWGHYSLAQVIYITDNHPTIQSGIDAARDGDTVLIDEGTYYENIDFLGKAITVASRYLIDGDTSHISRTIINGSRSSSPDTASVVTMWSGEDTASILCGLSIMGGTGTFVNKIHTDFFLSPEINYYAGGGILLYNSGGKIIHNIIKENNLIHREQGRGSAGCGILAAVNNNHTAIIRNNIIRNNSSNMDQAWGGGICLYGGGMLVEHNYIQSNHHHVEELAVGSGIFFENEHMEGTIEEVIIRNNLITKNKTYGNTDAACGGGIALSWGFDSEEVQIYNNVIAYNEAGDVGGGLYCWNSHVNVYSNLIFNNKAERYGMNIGTEVENDLDMNNNLIWTGDNWIATYDGLTKLRLSKSRTTGFIPPKGIMREPFQSSFSINPANGEIHIGARDGMISFDPKSVSENVFLAPTMILDFHSYKNHDAVSGKKGENRPPSQYFRLDLFMDENFMSYRFAPLDFTSPQNSQYRFFMKGVDHDTTVTQKGEMVSYGNLKPGKYTFWSASIDKDGKTIPDEITFDISVHTPWYRSGWIIGGYVLFFTLLVLGLIKIRTARLKREKVALEHEVKKRTLELQQKNEQIVEMEQLKTRFFTDVSHEIRTPLSLITGPLDQLLRQDHHDSKSREWMIMIRRNSNRLLQLVNQLLDISRLDAGHMKLVLERSDVLKHLRMLVGEYRSLAESKGIRFIIEIPHEEMNIWNDREKIATITSNLLSNAIKFSPKNEIVTCRARIRQGRNSTDPPILRIIVADTGAGIPVKDREKIFNRFYRAPIDQYEDAGGTGIGLALARELIHLMHGEITLKSLQGTGTIFFVTIPLGKDHLSEQEYILKDRDLIEPLEMISKSGEDQIAGKEKFQDQEVEVLIVEDSEDLRCFIREELSNSYRITEAEDGIKGLKLAQSQIPDLIISDIMMPGMDGMELCKRLKQDERTSHIPVIMLTARSTGGDKIKGLVIGADDYIFKPFNLEELSVRIRNLLDQRERLRKKYSNMIGMNWGELSVTTLEEKFLKKAMGIISDNMKDIDFIVSTLQDKMSVSRTHLYRKMKALTGKSPSDLIREMRIKTAASIIKNSNTKITEISLNVGFSNVSYFTHCFKKQYGKTPREYRMEFRT